MFLFMVLLLVFHQINVQKHLFSCSCFKLSNLMFKSVIYLELILNTCIGFYSSSCDYSRDYVSSLYVLGTLAKNQFISVSLVFFSTSFHWFINCWSRCYTVAHVNEFTNIGNSKRFLNTRKPNINPKSNT